MQTHGAWAHLLGAGVAVPEPVPWAGLSRAVSKHNGWPGARGFRDFSRLPPAQENRGQPADPAPAVRHLSRAQGNEDIQWQPIPGRSMNWRAL